jgi:hypothetical protein
VNKASKINKKNNIIFLILNSNLYLKRNQKINLF